MSEPRTARTVRVDELDASDVGKRVRFRRPAAETGRPVVSGRLDMLEPAVFIRGNVPRPGFILTVSHQNRWGDSKRESYGPVSATFEVTVGGEWVNRHPTWDGELGEEGDAY